MTVGPAYDAVIVGGGAAGLSAALWLGRYHRRVLVLDEGAPRNEPTWAVHGFPGLPEIPPETLRRRLREQVESAGAGVQAATAVGCEGRKDAFVVETGAGERIPARRVLLAFGRRDRVPEIPGLAEAYGTSVFHCPDCDGPTVKDRRVAVLGADDDAVRLALFLTPWASELTLLTGDDTPGEPARALLDETGVRLVPGGVRQVRSSNGLLERIELVDDRQVTCDALFFHLGTYPSCQLAAILGCDCDTGGHVRVDRGQETTVPGIYAAGDLTGHPYLAITAAAEGVRAALAMHRSLLPPELEL